MADPQRVIVRAPNWLGDAVMALPAIAAVQRHAGGSLIIAARASVAPLFAESAALTATKVVVVDREQESLQLRAIDASTIVLFPNSFRSAWLAYRGGIPDRWGYASAVRRWLLTRAASRPTRELHQVQYYLELVRALGIEAADDVPRLTPRRSTLERADKVLADAGVDPSQQIVSFAAGAAYGHAKRWPPDRVAQVVEALNARSIQSVLVGAAADRDTVRAIESSVPRGLRVIDLVGRTTLTELIGVIARSAAFVSNDSGAMHVAAALGTPLTAIFGPTNERVTAPMGPNAREVILRDVFCRPCMLRECPIDHRCMKRVASSDVIASVEKHLGIGTSGRLPRS
jgi:heptosyltransferase-2